MPKKDKKLRILIVGKMRDGSSLRKVLSELNISKTSVRNIWNKFRHMGSVVDKSRSGRPPKCSERDTRLLSRNAKKEPFLSAHIPMLYSFMIISSIMLWEYPKNTNRDIPIDIFHLIEYLVGHLKTSTDRISKFYGSKTQANVVMEEKMLSKIIPRCQVMIEIKENRKPYRNI